MQDIEGQTRRHIH